MAVQSSTFAYHIGDTGPGGGIVFAVPFTGMNQTQYYYEIAYDQLDGYMDASQLSASCHFGCVMDGILSHVPCIVQANTIVIPLANLSSVTSITVQDILDSINGVQAINPNATNIPTSSNLQCPHKVDGEDANGDSIWGGPVNIVGFYQDPIALILYTNATQPINFAGVGSHPHLVNISFFSNNIPTAQPGPEWGVLGVTNNTLQNLSIGSDGFGDGYNNTVNLVNYINTNNIQPTVVNRTLAGVEADNYQTTLNNVIYDDWFLPSVKELEYAIQTVGPGAPGMNTIGDPLDNIAGFFIDPNTRKYWTSSLWNGGLNSSNHDQAKIIDATGALFGHQPWRCHTYSVRFVRRFKAKIEEEPMVFNYRDACMDPCQATNSTTFRGVFHPGAAGSGKCVIETKDGRIFPHDGLAPIITNPSHPNYNPTGTLTMQQVGYHAGLNNSTRTPGLSAGHNGFGSEGVIGANYFKFFIHQYDAMGYKYTKADCEVGPWIISIWDYEGNFLGKWRYNQLHSATMTNSSVAATDIGFGRAIVLTLKDVEQLDGPTNEFGIYLEPVVNYGTIIPTTSYSINTLAMLNLGKETLDALGRKGGVRSTGFHGRVHPFYEGQAMHGTNSGAFIKVESLFMKKAYQNQVTNHGGLVYSEKYPQFADIENYVGVIKDQPVICAAKGLAPTSMNLKIHTTGRTFGRGQGPGGQNYWAGMGQSPSSEMRGGTDVYFFPYAHLQHDNHGSDYRHSTLYQQFPNANTNYSKSRENTSFMWGVQHRFGTESIYQNKIILRNINAGAVHTSGFEEAVGLGYRRFEHQVLPWWSARELSWYQSSECPIPVPHVKDKSTWYPSLRTYLNARGWSDFSGKLPQLIHDWELNDIPISPNTGNAINNSFALLTFLCGNGTDTIYPEFNPARHGQYLTDKWFPENSINPQVLNTPCKIHLTKQHIFPTNPSTGYPDNQLECNILDVPGLTWNWNQTQLVNEFYTWSVGSVALQDNFIVLHFAAGSQFNRFTSVRKRHKETGMERGDYFEYSDKWRNPSVISNIAYTTGNPGSPGFQLSPFNFFGAADCYVTIVPFDNQQNINLWSSTNPHSQCDMFRGSIGGSQAKIANPNDITMVKKKVKTRSFKQIILDLYEKHPERFKGDDVVVDENEIIDISIDTFGDVTSQETQTYSSPTGGSTSSGGASDDSSEGGGVSDDSGERGEGYGGE